MENSQLQKKFVVTFWFWLFKSNSLFSVHRTKFSSRWSLWWVFSELFLQWSATLFLSKNLMYTFVRELIVLFTNRKNCSISRKVIKSNKRKTTGLVLAARTLDAHTLLKLAFRLVRVDRWKSGAISFVGCWYGASTLEIRGLFDEIQEIWQLGLSVIYFRAIIQMGLKSVMYSVELHRLGQISSQKITGIKLSRHYKQESKPHNMRNIAKNLSSI